MSVATETTAEIVHGDCLDWIRDQCEPVCDLVICSPPYEDARLYDELKFKLKGFDWVDWCLPRYIECLRVCRGLVAWVVEGKTRNFDWSGTPMILAAELKRRGVKLRKPPVFHRVGIPGSGGPDWLRNDYELIICAASGKLPWSDNTAMGHPPKWAPGGEMSNRTADGKRKNARDKPEARAARRNQWGHTLNSGAIELVNGKVRSEGKRPSHKFRKKYDGVTLANPGNVVTLKVGGGLMGSKIAHENEAPFPEKLVEFFVKSFCPPGGTAMDPFAGSGTVAAVCEKLGRNSISIDCRKSQVELIERRIIEARGAVNVCE